MKTKNMRKKALLSSVAMLLVAIVALSGATYAWFTANNSAKVSPISLSTTKQSNLLVSTAESGQPWSSALTVNWSDALIPMSCSTPGSFFIVTADTTKTITSTEADTYVSTITGATEGWLSESFYVKSGVACKLNLQTIAGGSALASALRIAVTVGSDTKIYAPSDSGSQISIDGTGVNSNVQYSDLYAGNDHIGGDAEAAATGVDFGSYNISATGTDINTQISANTATEVEVIIWLEGNDGDCENALSGVSLSDLALTFGSTPISG